MNSEVQRLFADYLQRGVSQHKRSWCAAASSLLRRNSGLWILLMSWMSVHATEPKLKWTTSYEGQDGASASALRATTDFANDLFICGNQGTALGNASATTLKYSGRDGHLIWRADYTNNVSTTYAGIRAIALDGSGNPFVTGLVRVNSETQSAFVVKYSNATGHEIWIRRVGDPNEWTTYASLTILSTNQALLVRYERKANAILVHGLNLESGETTRPAIYKLGSASLEFIQSVFMLSPEEVGIAGTLLSPANSLKPFLLRYIPKSDFWESYETFQGALGSVAVAPQSRVLLGGSVLWQSSGYIYQATSFRILQPGSSVFTLWSKDLDLSFPSNTPGSDMLTATGIDSQDNILLSGYSNRRGTGSGILTLKVSTATRVPVWSKLDQDQNYSTLRPIRVMSDLANNVIVAANALGGGFKIVSYDGTTGSTLWSLGNPLPAKTEIVEAILDRSGNLFAIGNQQNKIVALKYSPPHPPVATHLQILVTHATDLVIPLPVDDPDNDPLTVRFLAQPRHGTVTYKNSQLVYHFTNPTLVSDSFTLTGSDGELESGPAEVRLEPSGPDDDQDGIVDAWERGFGRYSIVSGIYSWQEAKADAEKRGGHLATFSNLSEWNDCKQVLGDVLTGKNLWIGGTDEGDEGRWRWITSEAWRFTNWRTNQPDNDILGNEQGLPENFLMIWGREVQSRDGRSAFWNDVPDNGGSLARDGYVLELGSWSDPLYSDTDFDGLSDLAETYPPSGTSSSDPTHPDTDGDGLQDAAEVKIYFTDPSRVDTDGDGLTDSQEVMLTHTKPSTMDSDGDGLTDWEEVVIFGTNALQADTDHDSWSDLEELKRQSNPLSALSIPSASATAKPAVEVLIQSKSNETYLLQSKNDQSEWETFGSPIQGTGGTIALLLKANEVPYPLLRVVLTHLGSPAPSGGL